MFNAHFSVSTTITVSSFNKLGSLPPHDSDDRFHDAISYSKKLGSAGYVMTAFGLIFQSDLISVVAELVGRILTTR